ncbi:ribosome-binding protein 1 isoform X2 [Chrysoperla carnea]|uniref:ribosome-binding protein 1 isoform X2 n=1 Tax=Chrysoperla carnea TaxID=189513 RepID=UPI001D08B2FE|nr:ribosome-binding protein 1 isoform X2 [Chrysoperla carnea]
MDLQTALVCGAVFVLTTGVLLLISVFGIKSKSFEEALAEQRDLKAGLLGISKQAKLKHAKEKKLKKLNRKNKEKSLVAVSSSSDGASGDETTASSSNETPDVLINDVNTKNIPIINVKPNNNIHVEFVIDEPEIIPPEPQVIKVGRKKQRELKPINVRPILVNRDPSPVSSFTPIDSPKTLNHFEKIHPKDEKELLKSQIVEKTNLSPKTKKNKNKNKNKDTEQENIPSDVVVTETNVVSGKKKQSKENINDGSNNPSPNPKKQTKAKKEVLQQPDKVKQDTLPEKVKKDTLPEKGKKENPPSVDKPKVEEKVDKQKSNTQAKTTSKSEVTEKSKASPTEKKQNEKNKNNQLKKENSAIPTTKSNQDVTKKDVAEKKDQIIEKTKKEQQNIDSKKSQTKNQINSIENGNKKVQSNPKKVNNVDAKNDIEKMKKDSVEKLKVDNISKKNNKVVEIIEKVTNQDVLVAYENGKKDSPPLKKNKKENLIEKKLDNDLAVLQDKKDVQEKNKKNTEMYNGFNGVHHVQNAVTSNGISAKESKKRKRELNALQQMSGDNTGVNVSLLVPLVRKAELSRSEVQILIDLLLNKQHDMPVAHQEWSEGRSDPVVKLRKQLAEREKALQAEQEAHVGVAAKLREIRGELNACMQAKRQFEEANVQVLNDRQQLINRLQQNLEHLQAEKQMLTKQLQQLNAKLNEERHSTRQFQDEHAKLQNQRQQLELAVSRLTEQHKENDAALKNKIGTLHNDLQEQINVANALRREAHAARSEADVLRDRISHLQTAADQAQELARQLEESHHTVAELEQRLTISMSNAQTMNEQLNKYEDDKLKSHSEIQCLQSQLECAHKIAKQQQEDNERIITQLKTELATFKQNANGSAEDDKQRQVEILNLHNELDSARAELKALKDELNQQKEKNNENISQVISKEHENQKKFLQRLFPDIKIIGTTTQEQFLTEYERLVRDIITKNKTDAQDRITIQQMKADFIQQSKAKDLEFTKQMKVIEENFQKELQECQKKSSKHLTDANEKIAKLQEQANRYKTIIDDTQLTLNKLEMSVAKEEQSWRAKLYMKDEEISQLKTKYSQIHSKQILELQEKLTEEEKRNKELILQCEQLRVRAFGAYVKLEDESSRLLSSEQNRNENSPDSNNSIDDVKLKVTNNSNGPATADSSLSEYQSSTSPSPAPSHSSPLNNSNNSVRSSKTKKKKAKK